MKKDLDTRTFSEICSSLSQVEWLDSDLQRMILLARSRVEVDCKFCHNRFVLLAPAFAFSSSELARDLQGFQDILRHFKT